MEPIITDVGIQMKDDQSFKIYRIDGSKNEIAYKGVKVYAFPTIYLFPAHRNGCVIDVESTTADSQEKECISGDVVLPIPYNGDRTAKNLLHFIANHRKEKTAIESTEKVTTEANHLHFESEESIDGSDSTVLSEIISSITGDANTQPPIDTSQENVRQQP
jgi:hypothetical protein